MECFTLSKKSSFNSAVISNAFPHAVSKSYSKLFLLSKRKTKFFLPMKYSLTLKLFSVGFVGDHW